VLRPASPPVAVGQPPLGPGHGGGPGRRACRRPGGAGRSPEADAAARARYRIGWTPEAEVAWAQMTADQHNCVKRTISEAEAVRMQQRRRQRIEKADDLRPRPRVDRHPEGRPVRPVGRKPSSTLPTRTRLPVRAARLLHTRVETPARFVQAPSANHVAINSAFFLAVYRPALTSFSLRPM
jgi:hypothetical protein